ncbi:MAG: hypothetical protein EI684_08435 [Candidatus Viridilinea halotolerans]|uniref:CRISPR type III-associated protein domain-containing protein n=1 Tax=Candidatus Viridilinea halotolerans TaxID=2491704 RepID=A0A426U280_9CHLR|nr:MAG: hypothetical protein EI684_08435 [Candidatus Viridilinea halotolerans]
MRWSMLKLTFRMTLQSDYHIGAGYGQGSSIDSALQRDADGLPVVRGTTVTGLLREGLRFLVEEAALGASPQWQQFSQQMPASAQRGRAPLAGDWLFGSPQQSKRWRISSARPFGLAPTQELHVQGAHGAAHVRVDPATRRAEQRKLFVREEGDQRWEFHFSATLDEASPTCYAEALLLVAAARAVRALGAGRRRGRGACSIHLHALEGWPQPIQEEALLTAFEDYWLQGKIHALPVAAAPAILPPEIDATPTPLRLLLLVRLDEPLLIARRAEAGNQFESLNYIPGFALRGALAARLHATSGIGAPGSAGFALLTEAFYREGVCFDHLYPCANLDPSGHALTPTFPAPADLFVDELHPRDKQLVEHEHPHYGAAAAAGKDFRSTTEAATLRLETLPHFIAVHEDGLLCSPKQSSEMHVTLDERTGRAKDQNLFGYVVLDAGQYMLGEIHTNSATWAKLTRMANLPEVPAEGYSEPFELRLGKAHRRGYGKLTALLQRRDPTSPGLLAQLPLEQRVRDPSQPLTLTLLSDAILLDTWGRFQQGFAADWLSDLLQTPVALHEVAGQCGVTHTLRFATTRTIDGFYNHVGLPRSRDLALAAGSAVTIRLLDPPSLPELLARLRVLEREGIGVRRHEGFGRLVVNLPFYNGTNHRLSEAQITLPKALRPASALPEQHALHQDVDFRSRWHRYLDECEWTLLKALELAVVAQILQSDLLPANANAAWQHLCDYGHAEHLLGTGWSQREKASRFKQSIAVKNSKVKQDEDEDERIILKKILHELERLAQGSAQRWRLGAAMLAERLVQANEGGRS